MTVSLIITSAYESKTIGRALEAIIKQDFREIVEILVVSPDQETLKVAKMFQKEFPKVQTLKDQGKGKPIALNQAFLSAKGEIFVLTDGDVYLGQDSLLLLLAPFSNPEVGGSCGRPISTNSRGSMLGFWSSYLTESAHQIRLKQSTTQQFIELSGYLLAIRKKLAVPLPSNTLADDSFLSHQILKSGHNTVYAPKATVFVKYPTSLKDWYRQKVRSSFDYWRNQYPPSETMRSPRKEILWLFSKFTLTYPKNLKEGFWLLFLFSARAFLWIMVIFLKLAHGPKASLWQRVESTK